MCLLSLWKQYKFGYLQVVALKMEVPVYLVYSQCKNRIHSYNITRTYSNFKNKYVCTKIAIAKEHNYIAQYLLCLSILFT